MPPAVLAPPPGNPNYVPVWGNREQCRVQLHPGTLGGHIPLIETVGDILVSDIDPATGEELESLAKEVMTATPDIIEKVKKMIGM